jgi:hypothetical protein
MICFLASLKAGRIVNRDSRIVDPKRYGHIYVVLPSTIVTHTSLNPV